MARLQRRRRFRSSDEVHEIVSSYEASGLSQAAFARSHGISPSSLSHWIHRRCRTRRHDSAGDTALVPVRVVPGARPSLAYEIRFSNDRVVRVPSGFDEGELRRLLAAVEPSC